MQERSFRLPLAAWSAGLILGVPVLISVAVFWIDLFRGPDPSAANSPAAQTVPAVTRVFAVKGMHCDGCADRVRTFLEKTPGVVSARVSFDQAKAWLDLGPNPPADADIEKAVAAAGYQASRVLE